MFRPPRDVSENYRMFMSELTPVIANLGNTNTEIMLAGDTNINLLKLNECDVYSELYANKLYIQKSHFQQGS